MIRMKVGGEIYRDNSFEKLKFGFSVSNIITAGLGFIKMTNYLLNQ
jgi:hypothetical protein